MGHALKMEKIEKIAILRTPKPPSRADRRLSCYSAPPLGMALIASLLRENGYRVLQDDLNIKVAYDDFFMNDKFPVHEFQDYENVMEYLKGDSDILEKALGRIISKTKLHDPDMIMLSAPDIVGTPVTVRLLFALSRYLKTKYSVPVIVGGSPRIIKAAEWGLRNRIFDYIVNGPADKGVLMLIKAIENGSGFDEVPGLCHIRNRRYHMNREAFPDISIIPDFDGLPMELYRWPPGKRDNSLMLPFMFSYGCPNNCAFCYSSKDDRKCGLLDHKEAVKNIMFLSNKYDTRQFMFLNTYFNISNAYSKKLCRELIHQDAGIMWSDCASERGMDRELITLAKKSGCIRLVYGFETGSARLQSLINKNLSLTNLSRALRHSNQAGIWNGIEVISGLPTENDEDIRSTAAFLNQNMEYLDEVYISEFRLSEVSHLGKTPERFSITNIRFRKGQEYVKNMEHFNYLGGEFDEINGLSWEEKKGQIRNSSKIIRQVCKRKSFILKNDQLNYLFYLYSRHNDKESIRAEYNRYMTKEYLKQFINPNWLAWRVKKSLQLSD